MQTSFSVAAPTACKSGRAHVPIARHSAKAIGFYHQVFACADCSLDDCDCWDGPLDRLHGLLVEWGMSPQEFELTVEQNADALKDFLLARVGDFE